MAHSTETINESLLTSEELKNLLLLLKHPDIQKMTQEVKDGKHDTK